VSLGGNLFYRINRDWLAMASAFLDRTSITHVDAAAAATRDPAVTGITGLLRIAYRS
jgi:hypothetical protein